MKNNFLKKAAAGIVLMSAFFFVYSANAGGYGLQKAAERANYDTGSGADVNSIVQVVVNGALAAFGFVFFFLIFFGGIRWLTARGNDELAARAKGYIESAIFGLIITLGAYALTTLIFSRLGQ